jgi:hypothetical protein
MARSAAVTPFGNSCAKADDPNMTMASAMLLKLLILDLPPMRPC